MPTSENSDSPDEILQRLCASTLIVTEAAGNLLKMSQRSLALRTTLPSVSVEQSMEVVIPTSRS